MSGFKKGEFREYRATAKIHLGDHGVDIHEDEIIEFDGIVLKHGIDEYQVPKLRGAVQKRWLVPASDTTSKYVSQPAGVQVRPTDTGNPMDRRRKSSSSMTMEAGGEEMVVSAPGFTDFTDPSNQERRHGRAVRGMQIEVEGNYDAVPVAAVTPLAKRGERTALVTNAGVATSQINNLDSKLRKAQPKVAARTAAPSMGGLSADEQAILQKLLAKSRGESAPEPDDEGPLGEAPWIKSREARDAAKAQAEAEREARLASMGVSSPVKAAPPEEPEPEVSLTDIMGDPPASEEDENEAKLAMVRQLIPDFDWDLSAHWKTRVKTACEEHVSNPTYMRGILMIETDSVKKYINQYLDQKGISI